MRLTVIISVLLHFGVAGLFYITWPQFADEFEPVVAVPFEIIREAELADELSVPEMRESPEPPPETPVEEVLPEADPEPLPEETNLPEDNPPPAEPEPEPQPEAPDPAPVEEAPEQQPEEPVEETPPDPTPPEPEEPSLDLAALESELVNIVPEETGAPQEVPQEAVQSLRDQQRIGLGARLTANEEALVRARVNQCWNRLSGAPEPEKLVVVIEFELNRDGSLLGVPRVMNRAQIRSSGNNFWIAAEQRAVQAVTNCAPYDFLSQDRYDAWREFRFNFRPPAE